MVLNVHRNHKACKDGEIWESGWGWGWVGVGVVVVVVGWIW